MRQRATQDNSVDRRCFARGCLKEDVDHVLRCPSDRRSDSRSKARHQLLSRLTKRCAPAPAAEVIVQALDRWFSSLQPSLAPSLPAGPGEPNQHLRQLANEAFVHQNNVGWGHFLRGRLSLHWKLRVAERYECRQPGDTRNPSLWVTKTVDAVWDLFLVTWTARNGELRGKSCEEQRAIALKATQSEVSRIREEARRRATGAERAVLSARPLEEILSWTKAHLDACLATAEVTLEQSVDPG